MDFLKGDKDFKEAIGALVIASSEMEFAVTKLCSMVGNDPREHEQQLYKWWGERLEKKREAITQFIKLQIPYLLSEWLKINSAIGSINEDRNFLVHGFTRYYLPNTHVVTYRKKKSKIVRKEFSLQAIKSLTNKIHHINTGANGINGVFQTKFFLARINTWNNLVDEERRMIYKVNEVILTDWKGA
jgi:hypothetical protein